VLRKMDSVASRILDKTCLQIGRRAVVLLPRPYGFLTDTINVDTIEVTGSIPVVSCLLGLIIHDLDS
jgi:hypothetical protein